MAAVTGLVVGAAAPAAGAPTAVQETTDDAANTAEQPTDEDVQFVQDTVREDLGDVAEFEIETDGQPEDVWLTIRDDRDVFDVTVQLTEIDHDEPIAVRWNSHHARDESEDIGLSAENADVNVTSADGQGIGAGHLPNLESGWTFDVEAYTSQTAANEGDLADVMLVDLQQRQTGDLTTHVAPGVDALDHDDDIDDILDQATERHIVADGDLLIAEIEVSGVFGYLETDPTGFVNDEFEFELVGPDTPFGDGPSVTVSELEAAATIVEQPDEDRLYVVVDSSEIPEIQDGESWEAEFSIDGDENPYVEDSDDEGADELASEFFFYEHREVELVGEFAGDYLLLPSDENTEITAYTNVAPGTDAGARVSLPGTYRTASGEVARDVSNHADGEFTATVDLSDVDAGAHLRTVRVRAPDSDTEHAVRGAVVVEDEPNFVVDVDARGTATPFGEEEPLRVGDDATLDVSVTNAGGVAGNESIEVTVDGETVDWGTVYLEPGDVWESSRELDTSDAGSIEWSVDAGSNSVDGELQVATPDIEFEFADESVRSGDTTALVRQDDTRAESVDVRLDAGGALDTQELERVFAAENATAVEGATDTVLVADVTEGEELETDLTDVAAGDYTFTVAFEDTGAADEADLTVEEESPANATFAEDSVTEDVGDVAEFEIETQDGADEVWLGVEDQHDVFDVTVQLTELEHDEPITVRWNSHHALDESESLGFSAAGATVAGVTADGQAVSSDREHLPNDYEGWMFDVETYDSEADAAAGDGSDSMVVGFRQRATGDLTTYTAPGVSALDHDDDIEDVLAEATERDTVADGDLLIAEIEVSGVFGYLNTEPTEFATEGLQFELAGPEGVFGGGADANVSELDGDATVVDRPEEDRIYVVVDSSEIPEIESRETWDVEFSIDGAENPYVDDESEDEAEEVASDPFVYEDREIEIVGQFDDSDRLELYSEEDAVINAETNVAPGTDVNLRVNLPRQYRTASTEVDEYGEVTATVDIAGFDEGTQVRSVLVRAPNSDTEHRVEGVIASESARFSPSIDAPETVTAGQADAVDVTVTNYGREAGQAVINVRADEETVFLETIALDVGEEWTESFDVDTDEFGDLTWTVVTQDGTRSEDVTVVADFDGEYEPLPYEGSELHWDVNGDGDVSNGDVTTFFSYQHTPTWDERPDLFDFDGNGDVGQGDVIELFEVVNGDSSI